MAAWPRFQYRWMLPLLFVTLTEGESRPRIEDGDRPLPRRARDYFPMPVSVTDCGEPVALSVMVKAATAAPVTCG